MTDPLVLQAHLSSTFLPISTLTRLTGGFANFTLRATVTPSSSAPVDNAATVIIKHAEPFAALFPHVSFDPIRCHFEHVVLASPPPAVTCARGLTLKIPTAYHYDKHHHILVLSDAGENSVTLKAWLLSPDSSTLKTSSLGQGLGVFLRSLHRWRGFPEPRNELEKNTQAAKLWTWATYGRLIETIDLFPSLLTPYKELFIDVISAPEVDEEKTLLHGDFWCGNILLSPEQEVATVIDWEMAKVGHVWGDIAQMCAELFLPFQFHGTEEGLEVMDAFLRAYGEVSEEVARRVVVHFGVHLVVWPCRVPGWGSAEAVEGCAKVGAEFIEKGWKKDWKWVKESVLGAVVKEEWIKD
ncbi:kinase-like protein [Wilcoxina mikolae CBS 423.85]|nr:kinase-like protein [Wilcoxina mikolae CBS 423.85]